MYFVIFGLLARICDSISDSSSRTVFYEGGDNPLVSCCRDAELPDGAARAGAGQPRVLRVSGRERERERERARVNITTYYSHYEPSQQRASSHTAPTAQSASVKAARKRGTGAFVTVFCEKLRDLDGGKGCVCLYQTDRGCKPVKSGVKSVSIVCECWAKSKMATNETKIWIAINPKII